MSSSNKEDQIDLSSPAVSNSPPSWSYQTSSKKVTNWLYSRAVAVSSFNKEDQIDLSSPAVGDSPPFSGLSHHFCPAEDWINQYNPVLIVFTTSQVKPCSNKRFINPAFHSFSNYSDCLSRLESSRNISLYPATNSAWPPWKWKWKWKWKTES